MRRFKVIASFVLVGFMILSGWTVYRRVKWYFSHLTDSSVSAALMSTGGRSKGDSGGTVTLRSGQGEDPKPIRLGAEMGIAAETGALPQPLEISIADPDRAAAELAEKIARTDGQSTAALVAAVRAAGFKIRDENGEVLFPQADPGQGISFDSWEVAAMAQSYGDGTHMMLGDLSTAFVQTLPGFQNIPLDKMLIEGIRADAESKKPALRFWARLIVELGRQTRPSYDLLSPEVKASDVQIDSVQFGLILRRLAADLAILGSKDKGKKQSLNTNCPGSSGQNTVSSREISPQLLNAAWHPASQLRLIEDADHAESTQKLPCTLPEPVLELIDAVAYVNGFGFDHLMELLGEEGTLTEFAGKIARGVSIFTLFANAVLSYGKLYWTAVSMHVEITMDGSQLVRTLNTVPGCRRNLKAKIEQKIGNWQFINCLRMAFNMAGLDFSLPQDGPLVDVKTQWLILKGKTTVSHEDNSITPAIVEWVGHSPHIQDAGTYAGIVGAAPGIAVSDFTQATTGEDGEVDIDIEGAPQNNSIIGKAVPVMKSAEVQLIFAAKPPKLSQDLVDAGGSGLGLISGPVGLLTTVPVELILRSRWFHSPIYIIPVKDWQECAGGWSGTISYSYDTACNQCGGLASTHLSHKLSLTITGNDSPGSDEKGTNVLVTGNAELENHLSNTYFGGGNLTEDDTAVLTGAQASVFISGDNYSIGLPNYTGNATWNCKFHLVRSDGSIEDINGGTPDKCGLQIPGFTIPVVNGTIDPKSPGKISGSKTFEFPDQGTLGWDLHYCGDPDRSCPQK